MSRKEIAMNLQEKIYDCRKKAGLSQEALAEKMDYFELAETSDYERVFAECMRFPVAGNVK